MTWKAIIPDFLVSVVPIIVGIIILLTHFNWLILFLMVLLFLLGFSGSAVVRGQLACPAQKLFEKAK